MIFHHDEEPPSTKFPSCCGRLLATREIFGPAHLPEPPQRRAEQLAARPSTPPRTCKKAECSLVASMAQISVPGAPPPTPLGHDQSRGSCLHQLPGGGNSWSFAQGRSHHPEQRRSGGASTVGVDTASLTVQLRRCGAMEGGAQLVRYTHTQRGCGV